ncbi:MAG: hypothetical protein ICV73_04575 [Acetobacteraceae bacterium]|nr:hypothetical protein [Acetobacteraceae bacterium]
MSDEADCAPVRVLGPSALCMPDGSIDAVQAEGTGTTTDVFAAEPSGIGHHRP